MSGLKNFFAKHEFLLFYANFIGISSSANFATVYLLANKFAVNVAASNLAASACEIFFLVFIASRFKCPDAENAKYSRLAISLAIPFALETIALHILISRHNCPFVPCKAAALCARLVLAVALESALPDSLRKNLRHFIGKFKFYILYIDFGGIATVVNIAVFVALYKDGAGLPSIPSNIAAWIVAVAVAFTTNKFWVFESKTTGLKTMLREIASFVAARLATLVVETAMIYVAVDLMRGNAILWKFFANIVVIVLNYIISKLFVFKKN